MLSVPILSLQCGERIGPLNPGPVKLSLTTDNFLRNKDLLMTDITVLGDFGLIGLTETHIYQTDTAVFLVSLTTVNYQQKVAIGGGISSFRKGIYSTKQLSLLIL